ncbi:MAG: 50S ribosomal protein L28 [Myxococcales bacterium]|nr:50S ribosomal protein L28 [Myxococcales bacterium]
MARRCELTGTGPLAGNNVSHAHNKTRMRQLPNLQSKRIWVPEFNSFVKVKLTARALRSIAKVGFVPFCKKNGIDHAKYKPTNG